MCAALPLQGDNFSELYAAFREATKVTEEDVDSFAVSGVAARWARAGSGRSREVCCSMFSN